MSLILLDKRLNYKRKMLAIAPMMDWTDTHCRVFHRLLAPHARLYTEMVHANAVIHGDRDRLLAMDPVEHPVALQLGGSEPGLLAQAARIGAELRSEEHTSELQSLMRISYAVFCLKKKNKNQTTRRAKLKKIEK